MAVRFLCTCVILLASFYSWLMTATGLHLTEYRPATGGIAGDLQPYILAALIHAATALFYLRLGSPTVMTRRERNTFIMVAPLILIFSLWSIVMSSYSIMFDRREMTSRLESGNNLQGISAELHSIDEQITAQFQSTLSNLDARLEREITNPQFGVARGCGPRCREFRATRIELENYQHLRMPMLVGAGISSTDLGKGLATLEAEYNQVVIRVADFEASSRIFSSLNAILAQEAKTKVGTAMAAMAPPRTEIQSTTPLKERLNELGEKLVEMRENGRSLVDAKYRGLTELVNDIGNVGGSFRVARALDFSIILLIAMAPDIISIAMALLSRSFSGVTTTETGMTTPTPLQAVRRLLRKRRRLGNGLEVDNVERLVTEQLRYRVTPHESGDNKD